MPAVPSLGQTAYSARTGKPAGIPVDVAVAQARASRHATCVDHVKVDGLAEKVCIAPGCDPLTVIDEARALAGLDQ